MRQHGIAITAISRNRFGDWSQFSDTAFGKRLGAGGGRDHLIDGHVKGRKEVGIKLLWQDVSGSALVHVFLADFCVICRVRQNLIHQVIQDVEDFWWDIEGA